MSTPPESFSASTPPDGDQEREFNQRLGIPNDPEEALDAALADLDEILHALDEAESAEGIDDDLRRILEELTGAPDAPLVYKSINRRVHEGYTDWFTVWSRPQDVPGGTQLVHDAVARQFGEAEAGLQQIRDELVRQQRRGSDGGE